MTSERLREGASQDGDAAALAARWRLAELSQALAATAPACAVEVVAQIDSTNSELMRRARQAPAAQVLLVAERQTAGRGRLGRNWHSNAPAPPGTGGAGQQALTFSIGLPYAPRNWSGLSLAVGVAVAGALHPAVGLKWPNDLWLHERKLAGILIETGVVGASRHLVVGVGLNILAPQAAGLATPPAWLQELLPDIDAPVALLRLAPVLLQTLRRFEARGFAPWRDAFAARDVLRERPVHLSDGSGGTACGVDEDGALLVRDGGALRRVSSAEVSVRPVPAGNARA